MGGTFWAKVGAWGAARDPGPAHGTLRSPATPTAVTRTPTVHAFIAAPPSKTTLRPTRRDRVEVLREMLRRAPREGLGRQRRVARAARAHDGPAEHPDIARLVREAVTVHDVRLDAVTHPRAAVRMR